MPLAMAPALEQLCLAARTWHALKLTAWGKLTFDERGVLNRVGPLPNTETLNPEP